MKNHKIIFHPTAGPKGGLILQILEEFKDVIAKSEIITITPEQAETMRFNPRVEIKDPKLLKEWEEVMKEINRIEKIKTKIITTLTVYRGGLSCSEIAKRIGATSREVAYILSCMSEQVMYDEAFNSWLLVGC